MEANDSPLFNMLQLMEEENGRREEFQLFGANWGPGPPDKVDRDCVNDDQIQIGTPASV